MCLLCARSIRVCAMCRVVDLKPLGPGQTFVRMLGYIFKDRGLPHFRNVMFGDITQEMIEDGISQYQSLKLSFMDDKIVLSRNSIFPRTYTFYHNNKDELPEDVTLSQTLAAMHNSKKYMFAATVFMNTGGQMRKSAAETYFNIVKGAPATAAMMENILYLTEYNRPTPGTRPADRAFDQPIFISRPDVPQDMGEFEPFTPVRARSCRTLLSNARRTSMRMCISHVIVACVAGSCGIRSQPI